MPFEGPGLQLKFQVEDWFPVRLRGQLDVKCAKNVAFARLADSADSRCRGLKMP